MTLLKLDAQQLDIWVARTEEHPAWTLSGHGGAILSEDEQARAQRYRFARDRDSYVVRHCLLRQVLSRYAARDPRDWRFATGAQGRPHIAHAHPDAPDLGFNLSHSRGLVLLAVGRGQGLGVDVEEVGAELAAVPIAEQFFAAAEAATLRALPASQQRERFYAHWTLKEAYVKAVGKGLSIPLEELAFELDGDGIRLHSGVAAHECAQWRFWQWAPGPGYLAAACARRSADGPHTLVVRRADAGLGGALMHHDILRASV